MQGLFIVIGVLISTITFQLHAVEGEEYNKCVDNDKILVNFTIDAQHHGLRYKSISSGTYAKKLRKCKRASDPFSTHCNIIKFQGFGREECQTVWYQKDASDNDRVPRLEVKIMLVDNVRDFAIDYSGSLSLPHLWCDLDMSKVEDYVCERPQEGRQASLLQPKPLLLHFQYITLNTGGQDAHFERIKGVTDAHHIYLECYHSTDSVPMSCPYLRITPDETIEGLVDTEPSNAKTYYKKIPQQGTGSFTLNLIQDDDTEDIRSATIGYCDYDSSTPDDLSCTFHD